MAATLSAISTSNRFMAASRLVFRRSGIGDVASAPGLRPYRNRERTIVAPDLRCPERGDDGGNEPGIAEIWPRWSTDISLREIVE